MNSYKRQAELLRAVAHPIRLRILEIIAEEESCVCHITAILKQRQPTVSQHLMILREAGLVKDRKDGLLVYYRPSDEGVIQILKLARELLGSRGEKVHILPIPRSPVKGCPCPKCENRAGLG